MNEKKSKSDNLMKILLIVCALGISAIAILLLSNFLQDRFTNLDDYEYSYNLGPGFYEVGVHLPAGTYVIQLGEGSEAVFSVYKTQESFIYYQKPYYVYDNEKGDKDIIKQPYGSIHYKHWGVARKKKIKNISLTEGQILKIEDQTSFIFYTNDVESTNANAIEITQVDIPILSNTAIAGKDFPAGVYNIMYESQDSNQSGTIKCLIKEINADYSSNGYSFVCEGKAGTQMIAHGIPFTPGSSIDIGNLDGVTLVATKYVGKTFHSLTWEADSN